MSWHFHLNESRVSKMSLERAKCGHQRNFYQSGAFSPYLEIEFGPYQILGGKNETYPIGDRRYGGSWFRQCIGG
jgi:hypothetical protein